MTDSGLLRDIIQPISHSPLASEGSQKKRAKMALGMGSWFWGRIGLADSIFGIFPA